MATCCDCGSTTAQLRPYGPNGAPICVSCAHATPARWAEAWRRMQEACNAALAQAEEDGSEVVLSLESGAPASAKRAAEHGGAVLTMAEGAILYGIPAAEA
jgi:hypothetical protein